MHPVKSLSRQLSSRTLQGNIGRRSSFNSAKRSTVKRFHALHLKSAVSSYSFSSTRAPLRPSPHMPPSVRNSLKVDNHQSLQRYRTSWVQQKYYAVFRTTMSMKSFLFLTLLLLESIPWSWAWESGSSKNPLEPEEGTFQRFCLKHWGHSIFVLKTGQTM